MRVAKATICRTEGLHHLPCAEMVTLSFFLKVPQNKMETPRLCRELLSQRVIEYST